MHSYDRMLPEQVMLEFIMNLMNNADLLLMQAAAKAAEKAKKESDDKIAASDKEEAKSDKVNNSRLHVLGLLHHCLDVSRLFCYCARAATWAAFRNRGSHHSARGVGLVCLIACILYLLEAV